MRRPSTLDALFPVPRQGILAATLMEPERWWYLSDLARHLKVHYATLQRELARLSKAAKEIDAASKYYAAVLAVKSETAGDVRLTAEKESAVLPKK